jgi:hypothetical protein
MFSSAVRTLNKYVCNTVSVLGNGNRSDGAMGMTADCINEQKHSKNPQRGTVFTCGCMTKLVQLGGKIAALVSGNRFFCNHSDIEFEIQTIVGQECAALWAPHQAF